MINIFVLAENSVFPVDMFQVEEPGLRELSSDWSNFLKKKQFILNIYLVFQTFFSA